MWNSHRLIWLPSEQTNSSTRSEETTMATSNNHSTGDDRQP